MSARFRAEFAVLAGIVIVYLIAMVAVGFAVRSRVKSTSDFLVAGRKLGLILTTATLAAVQLGAGVILGGAELGASSGFGPGMWAGIGAGGGLILAGVFVAKRLRRHGGFVPMDYFGRRYGESRSVRIWSWLSNIPSLLGIFVAQIMAAGGVMTLFGVSYVHGVLISGGVVLVYSSVGGMWGAVVTDLIQLVIIAVGVGAVVIAGALGLGDTQLASVGSIVSADFIPAGMESRAVFVILPFLISISVSYDAYMRYQAARSESVARAGCILGGAITVVIAAGAAFIGASGAVLYPDVPAGEIFATVLSQTLTPVFAGIVASALLAAAMSTANCLVISLSGCFVRDLYNKVLHPDQKLDDLPRAKALSRAVVAGAVAAGTLVAVYAKGILYTMIILNYPYMASMLVPLLGGVLWARATRQGAYAAMFSGGAVGVVCFVVGVVDPDNPLFSIDLGLMIAWLVAGVAFVVGSLMTRADVTARIAA